MRHIKTHNILESKIKRNFMDWLENPKQDSDIFLYQFSFPVKKIYNIFESESKNFKERISIFLLKKRGVDIYNEISRDMPCLFCSSEDQQNINTDCEFCNGSGKMSKDQIQSNFSQVFDEWIDKHFDGDITRFYRVYDLDFESNDIKENEFEDIKSNFNESRIQDSFRSSEFGLNFKIFKIKIDSGKLIDNLFTVIGSFESNKTLSEDEIDCVRDYLTGQISDEWGVYYTKKTINREVIGTIQFDTFMGLWWGEGYPVWYLEIKKVD